MLPKVLKYIKFILWLGVLVFTILTLITSFSFFREVNGAVGEKTDTGWIGSTVGFSVTGIIFVIIHFIFTLIVNSKYSMHKKIIRTIISFIFLVAVLFVLMIWGLIYLSITSIPFIGVIYMVILNMILVMVIIAAVVILIIYSLCTKTSAQKALKK